MGAHSRNSTSPVLGRLAGSGPLGGQGPSTCPGTSPVVSRSGDRGQRGEVGSRALTLCELSRDDDRHSGGQGFSLESESGEIPSPGGQLCKDEPPPPARQWEVLLGHLSSLEKLVPRGRLRLRSMQWQLKTIWSPEDDPPDLPVELTQEIREDLSWWTVESRLLQGVPFGTLPPGLNRSLLCGLGRSPTRPKGVREVVRRGDDVAHQSPRDEGSLARTAIVSEDSHCPSSDGDVRQLDGCSIRQQARRNAFSFHVRTDKPPSQMDGEHRRPFGSEISARTEQRPSGSPKPSGSGHCNGVDSPPSGGKGTSERVGFAVD